MKETILGINLNNLTNNIRQIKSLKLAKNKTCIAIIKSDAYGHGLLRIAGTLLENGVNFFGIVNIDEAYKLQKNQKGIKLLMLAGVDEYYIADAINMGLSLAVYERDRLELLLNYCHKLNKKANIHLKFDSGMNRLGFNVEEIKDTITLIKKNKACFNIEGLFSHFSSASSDLEYTLFQLSNFKEIIDVFSSNGLFPEYIHISASSAICNKDIEYDFSNAIRPGIAIYGISPNSCKAGLKPLMTLKSSIIQIKKIKKGSFVSYNNTYQAKEDMNIAVIAAGYDNGIPRLLSNKGRVIIKDEYAGIIGNITMNMLIADITKIKNAAVDDEVIIAGESKTKKVTIDEIAKVAQTIPYEICLNLGKSNKRIYII